MRKCRGRRCSRFSRSHLLQQSAPDHDFTALPYQSRYMPESAVPAFDAGNWQQNCCSYVPRCRRQNWVHKLESSVPFRINPMMESPSTFDPSCGGTKNYHFSPRESAVNSRSYSNRWCRFDDRSLGFKIEDGEFEEFGKIRRPRDFQRGCKNRN